MRDNDQFEKLLDQWATHRRTDPGPGESFSSGVMGRIVEPSPAPRSELPAQQFSNFALTAACFAAGIGKVLVIFHFAI